MIAVLAFVTLVACQVLDDGCAVVRVTACIQEQDSRDFGFCISGPGPVSPNALLKTLQGVTVITTEFHALEPGSCDEEIQTQCGLRPGDGPQPGCTPQLTWSVKPPTEPVGPSTTIE